MYFRLLVPERSRVEAVSGGTLVAVTAPAVVEDEAGRTVIGTYLMVPPGRRACGTRGRARTPPTRTRPAGATGSRSRSSPGCSRAADPHDPRAGRLPDHRREPEAGRERVNGDAGHDLRPRHHRAAGATVTAPGRVKTRSTVVSPSAWVLTQAQCLNPMPSPGVFVALPTSAECPSHSHDIVAADHDSHHSLGPPGGLDAGEPPLQPTGTKAPTDGTCVSRVCGVTAGLDGHGIRKDHTRRTEGSRFAGTVGVTGEPRTDTTSLSLRRESVPQPSAACASSGSDECNEMRLQRGKRTQHSRQATGARGPACDGGRQSDTAGADLASREQSADLVPAEPAGVPICRVHHEVVRHDEA